MIPLILPSSAAFLASVAFHAASVPTAPIPPAASLQLPPSSCLPRAATYSTAILLVPSHYPEASFLQPPSPQQPCPEGDASGRPAPTALLVPSMTVRAAALVFPSVASCGATCTDARCHRQQALSFEHCRQWAPNLTSSSPTTTAGRCNDASAGGPELLGAWLPLSLVPS
jgi:hypothetical protein